MILNNEFTLLKISKNKLLIFKNGLYSKKYLAKETNTQKQFISFSEVVLDTRQKLWGKKNLKKRFYQKSKNTMFEIRVASYLYLLIIPFRLTYCCQFKNTSNNTFRKFSVSIFNK